MQKRLPIKNTPSLCYFPRYASMSWILFHLLSDSLYRKWQLAFNWKSIVLTSFPKCRNHGKLQQKHTTANPELSQKSARKKMAIETYRQCMAGEKKKYDHGYSSIATGLKR